jgi:hypothetical protein
MTPLSRKRHRRITAALILTLPAIDVATAHAQRIVADTDSRTVVAPHPYPHPNPRLPHPMPGPHPIPGPDPNAIRIWEQQQRDIAARLAWEQHQRDIAARLAWDQQQRAIAARLAWDCTFRDFMHSVATALA